MERFLLRDLTNLLADYVEYDQARQLRLKINPARIEITEWDEPDFDCSYRQTTVDGALKKKVRTTTDGEKTFLRYKNRKKEGRQYVLWPSGQRKVEANYREGKEEGLQYRWYSNGVKQFKQNWERGLRQGTSYHWHINGVLAATENYVAGIKQGPDPEWDDLGSLST